MWLTSDLHFGHDNIIRYCQRPFADVDTMEAELVHRWNQRVQPDDTVWVLGDVAMGRIINSLALVGRLAGTKRLVVGNHDRSFKADRPESSGQRKAVEWHQRYLDAGFASLHYGGVDITLPSGRSVHLSHFPYSGDSGGHEDRYTERRPLDDGRWLLHGHVHEAWRQRGRMINVGTDVWDYAPVHADTLDALITDVEARRPRAIVDIDGASIERMRDLYHQLDQRLVGTDDWGRNLDALNDVFHGDVAPPDAPVNHPVTIRWHDHVNARARLGNRFDAVLEVLRDHAPGLDRWGQPAGGVVWHDLL